MGRSLATGGSLPTVAPLQAWVIQPDLNPPFFHLKNAQSGRCLDLLLGVIQFPRDGVPVELSDCQPNRLSQKWRFDTQVGFSSRSQATDPSQRNPRLADLRMIRCAEASVISNTFCRNGAGHCSRLPQVFPRFIQLTLPRGGPGPVPRWRHPRVT